MNTDAKQSVLIDLQNGESAEEISENRNLPLALVQEWESCPPDLLFGDTDSILNTTFKSHMDAIEFETDTNSQFMDLAEKTAITLVTTMLTLPRDNIVPFAIFKECSDTLAKLVLALSKNNSNKPRVNPSSQDKLSKFQSIMKN